MITGVLDNAPKGLPKRYCRRFCRHFVRFVFGPRRLGQGRRDQFLCFAWTIKEDRSVIRGFSFDNADLSEAGIRSTMIFEYLQLDITGTALNWSYPFCRGPRQHELTNGTKIRDWAA